MGRGAQDHPALLPVPSPGKSAMKTTSVCASRLLSSSCSRSRHGDSSSSSGSSQGVRRHGDHSARTRSTRGSTSLQHGAVRASPKCPPPTPNPRLPPLLEALVDGDPDVEVELWLGDVVARQDGAEARRVLLQHVRVVLPAPALREHLLGDPPPKKKSLSAPPHPPFYLPPDPAAHPRLEVAHLPGEPVAVRDLDVLVEARVHHHVPRVAVQPVGPVVVALGGCGVAEGVGV